jgi:nucleoside-diphosphate-sugar epimerase
MTIHGQTTRDRRPVLVTGAAGFIGHHTAGLLLDWGFPVIGIDSFTPYYARSTKERNLSALLERDGFRFTETFIDSPGTEQYLSDVQAVVHLAAQPGVRDSWAEFDTYVQLNIHATKWLLDAALRHGSPRVVSASSSSVYGEAPVYPTCEGAQTTPRSPYGITKLAAERLCVAYGLERGLSTVGLRYFTVFGPAQRPDMAIQRLITAAHEGTTFELFGDGRQIRDFTFVGDVARATALAAITELPPGSVFNVCSETPITVNDVIEVVEAVSGQTVQLERHSVSVGDVTRTGGSADMIADALGWRAETSLEDGIRAQVAEYRRRMSLAGLAA